jgi:hypothetical protein
MKKLTLILALVALSAPASAQVQQSQGKPAQASVKEKKDSADCSPQRAGARCSRPKPRKVWFWGKG